MIRKYLFVSEIQRGFLTESGLYARAAFEDVAD